MEKIREITTILYFSKVQSTLIFVVMLILGIIYADRLEGEWNNAFWEWIDPVGGIISLFITLAILYNQARSRWEESLEKRLSVAYKVYDKDLRKEIEIARIENAYLAGESDIRQWAQQLGRQIMGELKFDMAWKETPALVKYNFQNKKWYKNFEVVMHLAENPLKVDMNKKKIEDFLSENKRYHHSAIIGSVENLPIIWRRNL